MIQLVTQYGLALVFANVLLEQIGLPIPSLPTLVVAGALAADGEFSPWAIFGLALIACTISNAIWYLTGRLYGHRVLKLLCRVSLSPDSCVRQTENRFERWGGLTLVLGKFIPGLSTIAPPLAGAMRVGWSSFLALNALGAAIWAGAGIGAGVLLHAEISRLVARLENLGTVAIAVIAVLLAGYIAFKWWERRRFYKMLRVARVSADELRRLMDRGKHPVVVDLRGAIVRNQDPRFVPGALAMDIGEVDQRLEQLPTDRDVVFYCNCPNEEAAAYAAKKLIELGYTRVRPLEGGLDAWSAAGYEVEHRPPVTAGEAPVSATSSA